MVIVFTGNRIFIIWNMFYLFISSISTTILQVRLPLALSIFVFWNHLLTRAMMVSKCSVWQVSLGTCGWVLQSKSESWFLWRTENRLFPVTSGRGEEMARWLINLHKFGEAQSAKKRWTIGNHQVCFVGPPYSWDTPRLTVFYGSPRVQRNLTHFRVLHCFCMFLYRFLSSPNSSVLFCWGVNFGTFCVFSKSWHWEQIHQKRFGKGKTEFSSEFSTGCSKATFGPRSSSTLFQATFTDTELAQLRRWKWVGDSPHQRWKDVSNQNAGFFSCWETMKPNGVDIAINHPRFTWQDSFWFTKWRGLRLQRPTLVDVGRLWDACQQGWWRLDVKSGRFASQQTQPLFVHGIGSWNSKQNLLKNSAFGMTLVYIISGASDGDSEIPKKTKTA